METLESVERGFKVVVFWGVGCPVTPSRKVGAFGDSVRVAVPSEARKEASGSGVFWGFLPSVAKLFK